MPACSPPPFGVGDVSRRHDEVRTRPFRRCPTLTPADSSSATGRPSGRGNEFRRDPPREEPAQSTRCRGPGDSAPRGSAPRTLCVFGHYAIAQDRPGERENPAVEVIGGTLFAAAGTLLIALGLCDMFNVALPGPLARLHEHGPLGLAVAVLLIIAVIVLWVDRPMSPPNPNGRNG